MHEVKSAHQIKVKQKPGTGRLAAAVLAFLTIMALLPILAVNANAEDNENSGDAGGDGDGKVAVVLDASDSMAEKDAGNGETRMEAAKKAANDTVKTLADKTETTVIAYGSKESNAPDNREKGCQDITTLAPLGKNLSLIHI